MSVATEALLREVIAYMRSCCSQLEAIERNQRDILAVLDRKKVVVGNEGIHSSVAFGSGAKLAKGKK